MRIHRFYIQTSISGDNFDISDKDLVHQWKNVFRYNVGSQVIVFDGSGVDYLCMISSLRNMGATLAVIKKQKTADTSQRKNIWLCMAIVKKDNFEWIVQKATELGVGVIVPIICEHSEKRKLNTERLLKIAIEATEQSGRGDIPEIFPATNMDDLFSKGTLPQDKIAFHPNSGSFKDFINSSEAKSIACFVGPEGGFSDKEIAFFKSYNTPVLSLGSQILRAETAAIAVSTLLLF